jgi:predicted dehydrogenase
VRAYGHGRRDLFAALQPDRDVTDHYTATLEWADGFHATLVHSWVDPADDAFTGVSQRIVGTAGGLDFGSGGVTFRDRGRPRLSLHPGNLPDTRLALLAFLDAIRAGTPTAPPVTLAEARDATLTGLLVRRAVDEQRLVTLDEILAEAGTA